MFTLTTDLIIAGAPPERAGVASGIAETSTEFGGSLRIAVLGSIVTAIYRNQMAHIVPEAIPERVADATRDTIGGAIASAADMAGPLGAQLIAQLIEASRAAFVAAFQSAAWVSTFLALVTALMTVTVLGRSQTILERR